MHEALNGAGLFLSQQGIRALSKNFEDNGGFQYKDFLRALRVDLTPRALAAVGAAYAKLGGGDALTAAALKAGFNPESSQMFRAGQWTAEEATEDFVALMCAHARVQPSDEASISRDAFFEFYQDMRMCEPSDDYLVRQVELAWGVQEPGRGPSEKEVDEGILELRTALMQSTQGIKDEVKLRRFIQRWNNTGRVSPEELYELFLECGLATSKTIAEAIVRRIDLEKCGTADMMKLCEVVCNLDPRWHE